VQIQNTGNANFMFFHLRSDLLVCVQELRRSMDEIVIVLEKLSWGSYVVSRLSIGKSLHVAPEEAGTKSVINLNSPEGKSSMKPVNGSNISVASKESPAKSSKGSLKMEEESVKKGSKKSTSSEKKSSSSKAEVEKKSVKKSGVKKKKAPVKEKSKESAKKANWNL